MKYSGTITWLKENDKYLRASVTAQVAGTKLEGRYIFDGFPYRFECIMQKEDYFVGKLYDGSVECGVTYLWKYSHGEQIIFRGQWQEWNINYDCYLDLSKAAE